MNKLYHHYHLPSNTYFIECKCNQEWTIGCDDTGTCTCKEDYTGLKCDTCLPMFYGFPNCQGNQSILCHQIL